LKGIKFEGSKGPLGRAKTTLWYQTLSCLIFPINIFRIYMKYLYLAQVLVNKIPC
jgi:hypothetical protein